MNGINAVIFILILGILALYGYYLWKITKLFKRVNLKITDIESAMTVNKNINYLADYGLVEGEEFPAISVMNDRGISQELKLSEGKENIILITGIGCLPCEDTLSKIAHVDLKKVNQNLIFLSFDNPNSTQIEVRERHLKLVSNISDSQMIIDEKVLSVLKTNSFPTLIKVNPDGKVQGTYSGHYQSIVNHLEFISTKNLVS
ncbi:hypothetical protein [Paenibacillus sp. OAE614]|uniref:hypothetical protein n=1 Tax=Paenibacillus sp. OAE614 TaxID=2663804 RepID=UPI00178A846F